VVRKFIRDGDLVLRRKPNAANAGKLQPKWEGPYMTKAAGKQPLIPRTSIVCVGSTYNCKGVASTEL
jgi:hypothetical protein